MARTYIAHSAHPLPPAPPPAHDSAHEVSGGLSLTGNYRGPMGFRDSYLGKLRTRIGHDLVLMPGAGVLVLDADDRVLLTKRTDDGTWCMPGGGAEVGSSFASTAQAELAEETGIATEINDLVPFASVSEAEVHTLHYPNGDVTHCFTLWFVLRWDGSEQDVQIDEESLDFGFFVQDSLPQPMARASELALQLHDAYLTSGQFQAR